MSEFIGRASVPSKTPEQLDEAALRAILADEEAAVRDGIEALVRGRLSAAIKFVDDTAKTAPRAVLDVLFDVRNILTKGNPS